MKAVLIVAIIVVGALIAFGFMKWSTRSGETKKALRKERNEYRSMVGKARQVGYDLRGTDPLAGDMILQATQRKEEVEEDR